VRILITNDDGIDAPGIIAMTVALDQWNQSLGSPHELIVLAPNRNFSGASSAVGDVFSASGIDFTRAEVPGAKTVEAYALDAAPALCVIVGRRGAFGAAPDLVVSGINAGVNVGNSILHSGTIGAALTGSQLGCTGIAVSIQARKGADFSVAANLTLGLVEEVEHEPRGIVLSLNVPALPASEIKGIRRGRVAKAGLIKEVHRGEHHAHAHMKVGDKGVLDLKLGAAVPELGDVSDELENVDDGALINQGYVSITQLRTVSEVLDPDAALVTERAIEGVERHLARLG